MDRSSWFRGITCCSYCRRKQTYSNLHNRAHRLLRDIYGTAINVRETNKDAPEDFSGAFYKTGITSWPNDTLDAGSSIWSGSIGFSASLVVPTTPENRPVSVSLSLLIAF